MASADERRVVGYQVPLDVRATLAPLRSSKSDPCSALESNSYWKALNTPSGPATVAATVAGPDAVEFRAWGQGSQAALVDVHDWLGLNDPLETFDPSPSPVVADLARLRGPVRMGKFGSVTERLIPIVLGQLVIAEEASRSYSRLVRRLSEPAPGPLPLRLPPHPDQLADLGSHEFHVVGVERKRASIVQRVARESSRLERLTNASLDDAYRRLLSIKGIGPWSVTSLGGVAFGDPDAVVVGDYKLPHMVAWALAGKRQSNDEEMLELLAPFAGHRGRVQSLLKSSNTKPPRRGPKRAFREIERQ